VCWFFVVVVLVFFGGGIHGFLCVGLSLIIKYDNEAGTIVN